MLVLTVLYSYSLAFSLSIGRSVVPSIGLLENQSAHRRVIQIHRTFAQVKQIYLHIVL